jgi:hypothetical protein
VPWKIPLCGTSMRRSTGSQAPLPVTAHSA